jgi:Cu/Zn superoxide dismutase
MKTKLLTVVVTMGLLASCGTTARSSKESAVSFPLQAQNNSGVNGVATLTPEGGKTRVVLKLSGYTAAVPHPAHIHAGTCAKLDPKPKYPLNSVMNGTSTTLVDARLDAITGGVNAINVHKSTEDIKTYMACGNVSKS